MNEPIERNDAMADPRAPKEGTGSVKSRAQGMVAEGASAMPRLG